MNKKYIEIKIDNKVVIVAPIKECDPLKFVELEKEAKANLAALLADRNQEIQNLKKEIANLKGEIKVLKGEE